MGIENSEECAQSQCQSRQFFQRKSDYLEFSRYVTPQFPYHGARKTCTLLLDDIIEPYFFENNEGQTVVVNCEHQRRIITVFQISASPATLNVLRETFRGDRYDCITMTSTSPDCATKRRQNVESKFETIFHQC